MLIPTVFLVILLILFSNRVLILLYGPENSYKTLDIYFPIVSCYLVIRVIGDFGLISILRLTNNFKLLIYPSFLSAFLMLTLGVFLITQYNAAGAILGKFIILIINLIALFFLTKRIVNNHLNYERL